MENNVSTKRTMKKKVKLRRRNLPGCESGNANEWGPSYKTGRKSSIRAGTERSELAVCDNIKSGK
jgi:hypothetical protein